jgi:dethiobiotin synthetase
LQPDAIEVEGAVAADSLCLAVVGTDTGVGKTLVSTALLELLRERGLNPAAFKPCETGCGRHGPLDALALRQASGASDDLEDVCPYRFLQPLAPAVAAAAEGRRVDFAALERAFRRLCARGRPVILEGAGGLLVPIAGDLTLADLLVRLRLPAIVVARDALGTLNHTALTVEALRRRGVPVRGVVLNRTTPRDDGTSRTNTAWISRMTGLPVLSRLRHVADPERRRLAAERQLGRSFASLFPSKARAARTPRRGADRAWTH